MCHKILSVLILGVVLIFNTTLAGASKSNTVHSVNTVSTTNTMNPPKITLIVPEISIKNQKHEIHQGTVQVSYDSDNDKLHKVYITKGINKISYYLNNDGVSETFPLQFGNGKYKVSILENISGSKYKYILTKTIELNLKDEKEIFLNSVQNIKWDEDSSAALVAAKLTKNLENDQKKIKVIYDYCVNNITYDNAKFATIKSDYIPDPDTTLKTGKGNCYDFSSTFAAMLRSVEIPAKLVKGYSKNAIGYHAWNEVYSSDTDKWIIVDIAYDSQMKAVRASYKMIKDSKCYKATYAY